MRGVAVLLVLLHHGKVPGFAGGFVGVDVFFVISGFVITWSILTSTAERKFSSTEFMARRVVRLGPAILTTIAASSVVAIVTLMPRQYSEFFQSAIASVGFVSNYYFWDATGYFATAAAEKPLLHTWSLAVEEQFYILVALSSPWWSARLRAGKGLAMPVAVVALLGWASYLITEQLASSVAFYWTLFRAWELLVGVLLATHMAPLAAPVAPGRFAGWLLAAGIGAIALATAGVQVIGVSAATSLAVAGAALLIVGAVRCECTHLTALGLTTIGLGSFSIYLVHQPLFAYARVIHSEEIGGALIAALILLAIGVGLGMHRTIERPIRQAYRRKPPSRKRAATVLWLFLAVCTASAGLLALGSTINWQRLQWVADAQTIHDIKILDRAGSERGVPEPECFVEGPRAGAPWRQRLERCLDQYQSMDVLIGDSHAGDIAGAIAAHAGQRLLVTFYAGGCRAYSPLKRCPFGDAVVFIAQHKEHIEQVLFVDQGSHYLKLSADGSSVEDKIHRTASYLESLSSSCPVTWLGPKYEIGVDFRSANLLGAKSLQDHVQEAETASDIPQLETLIQKRLQGTAIGFHSVFESVAFDAEHDVMINGQLSFSDADHWSAHGERELGRRVVKALQSRGILAE